MKGYKKNSKKWCMVCIMVLATFSILWVGMNLSMIFGRFEISVDNIIDVIDEKYNNCIKMAGMIIPVIYSVSFGYIFVIDKNYVILRYGRNRYGKKETKKVCIFSILFAAIYICTDVMLMSIFVRHSVLTDTSYYLYIILRFIMMVSYLSMIGMTLLFLRNVMMFLDIYFIIGGMIYVFLTLLYYTIGTVNIPVMYMAFADEWFTRHKFDGLSYIINIAKMFLTSLILMYLGQITFMKRDIIGNEEV